MPYPYMNSPYMQQQFQMPSAYQPAQAQYSAPVMPYQQQSLGSIKVDGPTEAMNRFLMRYPANQLVAGFVSEPLFDVNGRQFHTLSIEPDGRRNLETFDYKPHVERQSVEIDGAQFVSRQEFDDFTKRVNAALGAINGVHAAVPSAAADAAAQPAGGNDAGQDWHAQEPSGGQPAGRGGAALQV